MPALPAADDATVPQLDSLVPRDADTHLMARQPAIDFTAGRSLDASSLHDSAMAKRQVYAGIIPSYYNNDGPAAGMVVGITLGSVAGFLLVVWLLFSLAGINGGGGAHIAGEEEIVVRRRRGSNGHSGRSRRSTRTEVREYSRSPRRRSQTIVEERRGPPRTRSIIVEDRRVPGDDVVEVIEEHDDYRTRRNSRRGGYR